jgi:oxalate decarboxylase/phosphoglucose isomerase-like protein (cupin superfamily)
MMSDTGKLTFVEADEVETQVFDWGKLSFLSSPRVTGARQFSAGVVTLDPGQGHAQHNHPDSEEILYIVEGRGRQMVDIDGKQVEREVGPGMLIHLGPGVDHSTINTGDTPMVIFVVYSPCGPEEFLRSLPDCRIEPPRRAPTGP